MDANDYSIGLHGPPADGSGVHATTMNLTNDLTEWNPTPSHSRNSSAGSSVSSPFPSVFSTRTHSRWPSSVSSLATSPALATSPDSPPTLAKSALQDLQEEPLERNAELVVAAHTDMLDEFCLCDSIFCEHQRIHSPPGSPAASPLPSIDHVFDISGSAFGSANERRNSDDKSRDVGSTKRSGRFRSISNRWRQRMPASSVPAPVSGVRSAPPSRSPSLRNLRWASSFVSQFHSPKLDAVQQRSHRGQPSCDTSWEPDILDDPFFLDLAGEAVEPDNIQPERSPTPLLPSLLSSLQSDHGFDHESTLPPPMPPATSSSDSLPRSPPPSPTNSAVRSPILSPKPSTTSVRTATSFHCSNTLAPEPGDEFDKWAIKLGHANFHVTPAPYLPTITDSNPSTMTEVCLRLRSDWELARVAFMRQAALTAEHYGLASRTYALTCEKWEEVDALWRLNFNRIRSAVVESGDDGQSVFFVSTDGVQASVPDLRPLPETQAMLQMPRLHEDKFPAVDAVDIVGPMLRFEAPPTSLSVTAQDVAGSRKGGALLRLFSDTAALLRKS